MKFYIPKHQKSKQYQDIDRVHEKKDYTWIIPVAILVIILGFLIAYASSCTTDKKVQKYVKLHPEIKTSICDSVRVVHRIDTVKGEPIIKETIIQDTTNYTAFFDLLNFNAAIDKKSAIDSTIDWYKKHPKIVRIETKIPEYIKDIQVINDPVVNQANYNRGFEKGKEYQSGLFNWWKLAFYCLLFLSFCVLIIEFMMLRKK